MIKYEHLCGKEFDWETRYCYSLVRALYWDNFQLDLPDIACPIDFASLRMNLCSLLADEVGFDILHCHPRDYRAGDVVLMAIQSPYGNHMGVLLEDGRLIHHMPSQLSMVTPYGGIFRNNTVGVYRHRSNPTTNDGEETLDFRSLLSPVVLRKLEEIEAARESSPTELAGDRSSTES